MERSHMKTNILYLKKSKHCWADKANRCLIPQAKQEATVPYSMLPCYQTLWWVISLQSCVQHYLELCNAVHNFPCILPAFPIFPEITGLQLIYSQFLVWWRTLTYGSSYLLVPFYHPRKGTTSPLELSLISPFHSSFVSSVLQTLLV